MKLSVALCTYNGAKYIEEQILSILDQTMAVDEIVVCDDGSTDETLLIINRIKEKSLAEIRVFCNETKLGVCDNFQKAVDLCRGDIIFLSDQDDVWYPHKVKTIVEWFEQHADKSVVFTNADLMDGFGKRINEASAFDCVGFTSNTQSAFKDGYRLEIFSRMNRATGATMAMLRSAVKYFSHFEDYNNKTFNNCCRVLHDSYLANQSASEDRLGFIVDSLMLYRIHNTQNCGLPLFSSPFTDKGAFYDSSINVSKYDFFDFHGKQYVKKLDFIKKRKHYISSLSIVGLLCSINQYKDVYNADWRKVLFLTLKR